MGVVQSACGQNLREFKPSENCSLHLHHLLCTLSEETLQCQIESRENVQVLKSDTIMFFFGLIYIIMSLHM